jgi:hypothetical protein
LSHLDINLYDNSVERVLETFNYLEKLLSIQQCLLNLRLVFPNGSGKMLIETFQSRLESFKRLELVKWNFSGCDWKWLEKCPNLIEFAITNPSQTQVTDILGSNYETHHLKLSKNSKIATAHWHFNKDMTISSKSNFYFHPDKSSMELYDKSPIIIKPPSTIKLSRKKFGFEDYSDIDDNFDFEDHFDFEDYFGCSPETWYYCYDPSD